MGSTGRSAGKRQPISPHRVGVSYRGGVRNRCPDWLTCVRTVLWLVMVGCCVPTSQCCPSSRHGPKLHYVGRGRYGLRVRWEDEPQVTVSWGDERYMGGSRSQIIRAVNWKDDYSSPTGERNFSNSRTNHFESWSEHWVKLAEKYFLNSRHKNCVEFGEKYCSTTGRLIQWAMVVLRWPLTVTGMIYDDGVRWRKICVIA